MDVHGLVRDFQLFLSHSVVQVFVQQEVHVHGLPSWVAVGCHGLVGQGHKDPSCQAGNGWDMLWFGWLATRKLYPRHNKGNRLVEHDGS